MAVGASPFNLSGTLDTSSKSSAVGGSIGDSINYGLADKFGLVKMLAAVGGLVLIFWIWRR